jgi:hypothetical protein
MRSQRLFWHSVRSTYYFANTDCLSRILSIALHPYYKLAYIELAWGGAKEQEVEYEAGNFEAKNWQDEARKVLEKTVTLSHHDDAPAAPPNMSLVLQVKQYWKTRPNASTIHDPSPAVTAKQTEDSIISEFDRHRLSLMSREQDGGWEAELRRYLKDLPANVSKETDIVEWWQVCLTATSIITLFAHWF